MVTNLVCISQTDFESYDLPEEYKLSNINLRGVPLMIFERTYDKYVNMVPSPVKTGEFSQESSKWKLGKSFSTCSAHQWFGREASWLQ